MKTSMGTAPKPETLEATSNEKLNTQPQTEVSGSLSVSIGNKNLCELTIPPEVRLRRLEVGGVLIRRGSSTRLLT